MIKQSLKDEEWSFRDRSMDQWHKAQVPGTLFSDMLREGLLRRPYYRFQEKEMLSLAEQDYEYRCSFRVTEELFDRERQFLVFEGLDTITEVFLNEVLVAKTDNMHRTYRIPVKEWLRPGVNHLKVVFYSPVRYIAEKHARNPLPEFNTASLPGFSQIRKMHSAFRWDAEPLVPDSGIWRPVYLEGYDEVRLQHVYIRQKHAGDVVFLTAEVNAELAPGGDCTGVFELFRPDGVREQYLEAVMKQGTNRFMAELKHPQLWWPNGYGEQPLYRVRISILSGHQEMDHKEITIGIREAVIRREKDEFGESFEININKVPIFAKGGCYTPPDKFITECRGKRHEDLIRHCASANYNCIRVWGGAVYPDDEFFDLCDRYGLLVWLDLMFACALYHVTEEFAENIRAETADNVTRLRNHASLLLWCGSNENEWFHDMEHARRGLTNELRMDNLRQYEVILKDVVSVYDQERLYWPSSPSSGGGYEEPNGYRKGDVHCWYVWYLPAKPYTFYRECTGRFISEYGLESFQSIKTLSHYMEPEDMGPNTEVMDYMQHCSDDHCDMGNAKIISYIFQEVRPPKDFDEYVYASQYAQAEGIKYGTTHWRRLKPRCMGTLYWQIADCFPGPTWSGLDYEFRWKILHYYAKRFFQQILISAEDNGDKPVIYVVNDNPHEYRVRVSWQLKNNAGSVIEEGGGEFALEASSSRPLIALDFGGYFEKGKRTETYLEFSLSSLEGEVLGSDTMLFVKPKHFHFLKPEMICQVTETEESFEVQISTSVYTKCIQLDLRQEEGVFSDNCFDLSPGRIKKVVLGKETLSRKMTLSELREELFQRNLNCIGNVI